jgi:nucleotide-binding universal stress UspA family protein
MPWGAGHRTVERMGTGPIIVGYDGSPSSQRAIDEAGALLSRHRALVVVVWEAGLGSALVDVPAIPPAPIDVRVALEVDKTLYERAQRLAQHGAQLAEKAGLEADPLVVADTITVAETLVRLAREKDAQAIALGTDGIGLTDVLLGGTTRGVIQHASCPVVVVREPKQRARA